MEPGKIYLGIVVTVAISIATAGIYSMFKEKEIAVACVQSGGEWKNVTPDRINITLGCIRK